VDALAGSLRKVPQVPGHEDRLRRGGNLEEGDIVLVWEVGSQGDCRDGLGGSADEVKDGASLSGRNGEAGAPQDRLVLREDSLIHTGLDHAFDHEVENPTARAGGG